jgi:hypothetical protein
MEERTMGVSEICHRACLEGWLASRNEKEGGVRDIEQGGRGNKEKTRQEGKVRGEGGK